MLAALYGAKVALYRSFRASVIYCPTMNCTHVLKVSEGDLVSPLDSVALARGVTGLWTMRDRLQWVGSTNSQLGVADVQDEVPYGQAWPLTPALSPEGRGSEGTACPVRSCCAVGAFSHS